MMGSVAKCPDTRRPHRRRHAAGRRRRGRAGPLAADRLKGEWVRRRSSASPTVRAQGIVEWSQLTVEGAVSRRQRPDAHDEFSTPT